MSKFSWLIKITKNVYVLWPLMSDCQVAPQDELLSFTYLYLGVILLLVGVFCGKVFF